MKKIKCILLVDDDPTTNFLNEELITDMEIAEHIHVASNGKEALEYINQTSKLKDKNQTVHYPPNLIFLDINMPLMDGFEFLSHYNNLPKEKRSDVLLVFLTTSGSVKDQLKANSSDLVYAFLEKPLREGALLKVKDEYFRHFDVG